jgi:cell division protein FtsA
VDELERSSSLEIGMVNVGIAGQHIRSYQHRGILMRDDPEAYISQDDIDRLAANMQKLALPPGEEIIHALPQDYMVDNDFAIYNPIGMPGTRLEANFHIITGQVAAAKNIIKSVEGAGLGMQKLILEPLASSESVLHPEEKEAGVALVDIGGGTTDLAIFHEGIIRHTAVIPLGGNIITEDIKSGCNIIKTYAEALKIKHGSALALDGMENTAIVIPGLHGRAAKEIRLKNLAGIINARMEEIFEAVDYEIRHSGFKNKLSAGVVLTGGGALMKHSHQLMELVTGLDTRIGMPNSHITGKLSEKLSNPMYATGIGLVMLGFEQIKRRGTVNSGKQDEEGTGKKEGPKKPRIKFGTFFEKLVNGGMRMLNDDEKELE